MPIPHMITAKVLILTCLFIITNKTYAFNSILKSGVIPIPPRVTHDHPKVESIPPPCLSSPESRSQHVPNSSSSLLSTTITSFVITTALSLTALISHLPPAAAASTPRTSPPPHHDRIERVVDGDTVILSTTGRVRLIGINTPETVSPAQTSGRSPPDCYGPEASAFTKSYLPPGTKVTIETDDETADKYGRTLVYLYRDDDGSFVNGELVARGYARARTYNGGRNRRYEDLLKGYERTAREGRRGLWGVCAAATGDDKISAAKTTTTMTKAKVVATPSSLSGVVVELANPGDTKNCNDFETYDDARLWFDKYFPLYGDVARLDGDGDGIPCESLLSKEGRRKEKF